MRNRYVLTTETPRRFPRSVREAFPWEDKPNARGIDAPVIPLYAPWWVRLARKFFNL
jgi:hypothetical protein